MQIEQFDTGLKGQENIKKLVITDNVSAVGTGAGTAPTRTETVGKWTNTSNQITRVDVGTFTTDGIEEGSEVTVYGTD